MKTLFLILLPSLAFAGGQKYRYPYPRGLDDEMQNIYSSIPNKSTTPSVYSGAGVPSTIPQKVGDIFVNTTSGKVYLATSTATSGSWTILN